MSAGANDALGRSFVAIAAILALLCTTILVHSTLVSQDVPFLVPGGKGAWIEFPMPPDTDAIFVDTRDVPEITFSRHFRVDPVPARIGLSGRALREAEVSLNGKSVPLAETPSWRSRFEADISDRVRAGRNEIRVTVRNATGPALLQLAIRGDGIELETDASWESSARGGVANAQITSDVGLHPEAFEMPTPGALFLDHFGVVACLFALSAIAYLALARLGATRLGAARLGAARLGAARLGAARLARAPEWTLGILSAFWLAVFAFKSSQLPVLVGFDIPAHLHYIDFLLDNGRLPLATDGWSTYHPPVFYLLTTAIVSLTGVVRESGAGQVIYRLIPFLAGLGNVWMTWAIARRLFPGDPLRTSLAVAAAGLLPMNLYMSAYVSNEALHGAFVSLSLLIACRLLMQSGVTPRLLAGLAVALALAVLTKYTSVLLVPVVLFFVALKHWRVDRGPLPRSVGIAAAVATGVLLLAGWFYLRNWIHFGNPLVGNWDATGRITWWEQPGFHTFAYYTRFGTALSHPFFAGYASFWDGIYSTAWGDGLVAGMVRLSTRHPQWNYDFMTLTYALALPATLLAPVGFARTLALALKDADPGRRCVHALLATTLFVVAFALLRVTISLPFYAQAKAFYGIAAVVPLSIVLALGLAALPERLGRGSRTLVALYWGWLGALAGVIALAFLG